MGVSDAHFEAASEIAALWPGRTPACTEPKMTAHRECGWKRGERAVPRNRRSRSHAVNCLTGGYLLMEAPERRISKILDELGLPRVKLGR